MWGGAGWGEAPGGGAGDSVACSPAQPAQTSSSPLSKTQTIQGRPCPLPWAAAHISPAPTPLTANRRGPCSLELQDGLVIHPLQLLQQVHLRDA